MYLGYEAAMQITAVLLQALAARLEVYGLQYVITKNGVKSIGAQVHLQPAAQQDHIYDFG